MTFNNLMYELGIRSIQLRRVGDKLRCRGDKGTIDSVLLKALKEHKSSIFEWIGEKTDTWHTPCDIISVDRNGSLPLSFAQQRLWFLAQLEKNAGRAYHMPAGIKLTGVLDTAALKAALDRIVWRHDVLRTTFTQQDGVPRQVIIPPEHLFFLVEHDLEGRSESELERLVTEEADTPFDLAAGPLIRGRLIRLCDTEHILLVTMHHIVSDGWSIGVLINELVALYDAFSNGQDDPLPPLAIQYADYAVWQRKWLEGDVLQQQLAFWTGQLEGAPALLDLPVDHLRPAVQDYKGAATGFGLDAELTKDLKALSRRHGITLFMTLLAGWAALLARLSHQDDVVIGTPVANRMRSEIEPLIGFFVNTLALRVDLAGRPSVSELLARVKQLAKEAQSHQDIPFEQVVKAAAPVRSLSHSPLFQVMFAWQNNVEGRFEPEGLELEDIDIPHTTTHFDLSLSMREAGTRIAGELEYAAALFEQDTIERYLGYYQTLLRAMASGDSCKVDQLRILGQVERRQVLFDWNVTEAAYPKDTCIHQLFEEQVEKTPDAVAVVYEDRSLTYNELNRQANRLAHHLIGLGVGPDTIVAICAERSLEMVVGLLSVLKAGGAYVPLDPAYPAERLEFMLEDSAPRVLLTQSALKERWSNLAVHVTVVELDAQTRSWEPLAASNREPRDLGFTARHPAYVIYTSGSTGKPKGVMVEHRGLVNLAAAQMRDFEVTADSRILQFVSFSFDMFISEVAMTLCSGAMLHLHSGQVRLNSETLLEMVTRQHITHLSIPPSVLATWPESANLESVRCMIVAGDRLPGALVQRWAKGRLFFNAYGPTENTVCATAHRCHARHDGDPPIGGPIANTRMYVLDQNRQPVPVGVAGELFTGGIQVARGYLNRAELTAERFLPDPFTDATGQELEARMYRTGDLGRWLPDGTIEFLGRNDFQVKIRGYRIELGEIEARLAEINGVAEAVVLAAQDATGGKRLVAYYTGSEEHSAETLRSSLSSVLPGYMVPPAYVHLEALPLTPNGKLDRKALPAPEGDAFGARAYEAPQGEAEQRLAAIWADLLQVETIGRQDHFFELGGHSLLAVTLISRMHKEGLHADVRTLFNAPILADLAAAVSAGPRQAPRQVPPNRIPTDCKHITPDMLTLVDLPQDAIERIVQAVPGGAANIADIYPLSPLQEGLLFHHLMTEAGDAYLLPTVLAFDTRQRLVGFIDALQRVIDRHDILRTAVLWEQLPEPVQVVWKSAPLSIKKMVLNGDHAADALVDRMDPRRHRIDVRKAPLMRAVMAEDKKEERWLLGLLSHHLAGDHTSLELIVEEVRAHLAGEQHHLPEPQAYRNFVAQARYGVSIEDHEAFFRQMLEAVDEPTAPYGLMDVQGDGSGIAEAGMALDNSLCLRLRERARQMGVSLASLCHLAWAQVLSLLAGREEVVFGTVLFGRMQGVEGIDRAIGMFINTLPMRIVAGGDPVDQAVRATHTQLSRLLHHEHAPLSLAQRCSAVPSAAPLFTALLNYRFSRDGDGPQAGETAWEGMQVLYGQERTNYPVLLNIDDFGQALGLNAQVQEPIDPMRICGYMRTALENLTDALGKTPQAHVRSIGIMDAAERQQVLFDWNVTGAAQPGNKCIHQLFEAQAEKTPDAVALVYEEKRLTYQALNQQANRLAHYLIDLGVTPDTIVAICMERSLEMVVGLLAVLKAGGAYVPLDPAHPDERLSFMLEDCAPVALLTQSSLKERWPDLPQKVALIELDAESRTWAKRSAANPGVGRLGLTPDHLAYVIYTSGSTGTPKGVMVEHANVVRLFSATEGWFDFGPDDVWTLFHSFAFDFSVWEIWGALLHGGRLVIAPQLTTRSPGDFYQLLCRQAVTVLNQTPSAFRQLIAVQAEHAPTDSHRLRLVIFGGEALETASLEPWYARNDSEDTRLFNMYGITETTVHVTCRPLALEDTQYHGASPIGVRIPDLRTYILDPHHQPVPVGVIGELYIGGAGVARGYLNRPELTAERFLADPFAKATEHEPDPRMYRTGDLGRWLPDGNIEFLGRNDSQVKIRGYRIELGEIEARLCETEGVKEAVVLAAQDATFDTRLIAYYTGSHELGAQTLRSRLSGALPGYMVPAAYVHLTALPLTVNGKLDRQALPAPEGDAFSTSAYEEPQGESEQTLADIWAQLLHIDKIGRYDHFFELGGHSLLAVRLIAHIRTRLGVELPLAELFAHPGLSDLAIRVRNAGKSTLPAISAADRSEALPLSYAQQRLWFLDQLEENAGRAYHISGGVKLTGVLNTAILKAALNRIVQRHEVLRTTFTQKDGVPLQVIAPPETGFLLLEHDLTAGPESELTRLLAREAAAPFDLAAGPLIRGRLIRLCETQYILLVTMHHIVSDGWSMGVLVNELSAFYHAFLKGQDDPLPRLAIQYADYAVWQRRWLEGDLLQQQLAYWTDRFKTAPALLDLPTDHPRPAVQDYTGAASGFMLNAELTQDLKALSQRHGVTLFMTLLAGWAILLHRLSGQGDIVIGTPVANRTRSEIDPLIGFFVNTLAVRIDLTGRPTVAELLTKVKQLTLEAQSHQDIPFEQVVEAVNPVRSLSHSPLFQVMLAWQNTPEGRFEAGDLQLEWIQPPHTTTQFDLSLDMQEAGDEIVGQLRYATALFEQRTIERYLAHYRTLLGGMVAGENLRVDQLRILSRVERQQVLYDWNATGTEYPKDKCIHQLFEAQVHRIPDAAAVVYEEKRLTYQELNQQANRLAYHLAGLGVAPDTTVAICVERSLEMVVGLLAVLKAGGAYVPLDPAYPAQRLAYMLEDSAPRVLLTQSALKERWSNLSGHVTVIELDTQTRSWEQLAASNREPRDLGLTARHPAYVIYTSGSTGKPKGVMVEHRGLVNLAAAQMRDFEVTADSRILQFVSFSFDMFISEVAMTLCSGAMLHLHSGQVRFNSETLLEMVTRQHITHLSIPPSVLATWPESANLESVRCMIVAGDQLPGALVQRWAEGRLFLNAYGPTENTVCATAHRCHGQHDGNPSIGGPIANTRMYVLDQNRQPVPVGVAGELFTGGIQVARGYLNRAELTAERFLPDPFADATGQEPEARMYRTGDLGRWLPDGTIEFLGRNDFQVKIRGYRIELGEIEAKLAETQGVKEAVVLAAQDSTVGKRLVAYYTGSEELSAETLRSSLSSVLPGYMVPAAYVHLEALPLTPNGKLDRKALPAPEGDAFGARTYEAPQGEAEQSLAAIWAELLQVETIGRRDHFFELGGHSLLAVTLISRMHKEGLHADVRTLFAAPILADLAAAASAGSLQAPIEVPPNRIPADCKHITPDMLPLVDLTRDDIERIAADVPGGAANIADIYPLAPLQEGLLFHHLMTEEGDTYLLPIVLAFDTRKRLDGFIDALQKVIDCHDILRTSFLWEQLPEPVQVVWKSAPLPMEEMVLSGDHAGDALLDRIDPRRHRIDVRKAPLMRAILAEDKKEDRWLLGLLSHHLAVDHTSLELIVEEVQVHLAGKQEMLPEPLAYRNFVARARLAVSSKEHEEFFSQMLGTVDEPTAPLGLMDVRQDGSGIAEASLALDGGLCLRLRERARQMGVSLASLCHLAWAKVLSLLSGRIDVVFGTVLFGRMQGAEGIERAMGMFINTLPVRLVVGDEPVKQAVHTTHTLLSRLLHHEHASLALAQRCSAVKPPAPLFTALLNYRYSRGGDGSPAGAKAWEGIHVLYSEERSNYPFSLDVDDLGDGLALTAQVQTPIEPMRVCGYMATALEHLADALERAPGAAVRSIEVMGDAERRQVLCDWNATEAAYARDTCIHQLFEAQVEEIPDAVAVVHEDKQLTYARLNHRANQLARHLMAMGVRPDTRVAICVERGLEMVVGLLAVLKAGGAYVPLDPDYPAQRLGFMLNDCAPVALLTQRSLKARRPDLPAPVALIELDAEPQIWGRRSGSNPGCGRLGLSAEHPAYMIYTSGSTGEPKGVMVAHRSLVNQMVFMRERFNLGPDDRYLQFASLSFDFSVEEVFAALVSGAALVLRTHDWLTGAGDFWALCQRQGVSVVDLPTQFWSQLIQDPAPVAASVRQLMTGGEMISEQALQAWFGRSGHRPPLSNFYGPTEATINATLHEPRDAGDWRAIGRPVANSRIYILDSHGRPVPVGVSGELYIGGAGVARGYLNRPERTAERFLPDPFVLATTHEPDPRMYRTGDLGRFLPDGTIEFLGRKDFQVKIRGYRIELGEIEGRLSDFEGVKEVVVLAREDTPGDKRLTAYCTGGDVPAADALRAHLSSVLPGHMVPAAFVQLDALPLTPNGKLDRKALPAPADGAWHACAYKPPAGLLERNLTEIWSELLRMKWIGRHDNFFDLGGHSLMAMQMVSMMKQSGIDVPVAALFTHPTIERLAAYIEGEEKPLLPDGAVPIRREGNGSPLFLVHELSGDVFYAMSLAPHIDTDIPVFGLAGTPLGETPLRTMHAMAQRLVRIIRKIQPHGPYRIAGWSLGGNIAYEIATQLLGDDQDVAFVGLIDSINFVAIDPRQRQPLDDNTNLLNYALQQVDETDDALKDQLKTLAGTADLETFVQACQEKQLLAPQMSLEDIRHYLARAKGYDLALDDYHPQPIPVPVYLFKAIEKEEDSPIQDSDSDGHLGWTKALPKARIHVIPVPGTHLTMMSAPHIETLGRSMSEALRQAGAAKNAVSTQSDAGLFTIQGGQAGVLPIFCVPGAGANITAFTSLATAMGAPWPIHGLQPRGMDDGHVPHATVPAAARAYLRAIDDMYPDGPLHLLGHSFGGWAVFDMALRLRAAGRAVDSVTMVDAEAPEGNGIHGPEYNRPQMFMQLVELSELSAQCDLNLAEADFDGLDYPAQLHLLHSRLVAAQIMPQRSRPESLRGMVRTFAAHLRTTYVPPQTYPGPVRLVLVRDVRDDEATTRRKHEQAAAGWRCFTPELVTWRGPGNHMTILDPPHVAALADWLRAGALKPET